MKNNSIQKQELKRVTDAVKDFAEYGNIPLSESIKFYLKMNRHMLDDYVVDYLDNLLREIKRVEFNRDVKCKEIKIRKKKEKELVKLINDIQNRLEVVRTNHGIDSDIYLSYLFVLSDLIISYKELLNGVE